MERASKLIRRLRLPGDTITMEEIACSAWAEAVGRKIASHSRAVRMVRARLDVEVEDVIWQRQLFSLTPHILRNLQKALGPDVVEEVHFRIVPRRFEPARATQSLAAPHADESDGIGDPVMRSIYRLSKQRALG